MNDNNDSLPQSETEAEKRPGLQVAASPFNGVKLDLAIIILVMLLLWLVLAQTVTDGFVQTVVLFLYSVLAACWIIFRIRRILRQHIGD